MKRLAAFLLALLLAAPTAHAAEITLLHGWGTMEEEHEAMRGIYNGFMALRPDVRLTLVSLPDTTQALAKASDMLSVGEPPDLLFVAGVNSAVTDFMVQKGYALDLTPYLLADEAFMESVSPLTLRTWTTDDGALYTLTDVLSLNGLWQNDTLLAQSGATEPIRTWEDFFAVCEAIIAWSDQSGRDVRPIALNPEDLGNLTQFILAGLEADVTLGDAARLPEALAILKRLFAYAGEESLGFSYRDTLSLFNQGRTVFYLNGIWANAMIDPNVNARCVAFPGERGSVSGQSAMCGYVLGNTGDAARMEASVAFVKYMLSLPTQEAILTRTGQFPSNPAVAFSALPGVTPRFAEAARAIREADVSTQTLGLFYDEQEIVRIRGTLLDYLAGRIDTAQATAAIRAIPHP